MKFAHQRDGTIQYDISIKIGSETESDEYEGSLTYRIEQPGEVNVKADLHFKNSTRQRNLPVISYRSNLLKNIMDVSSRKLSVSSRGEVTSATGNEPLNMLLGDYLRFGIWTLPVGKEKKWKVSEPLIVQRTECNGRFSSLLYHPAHSVFTKTFTSAAIENISYRITETKGPITTIEQSYELNAKQSTPLLKITGKGTGQFDRTRGTFVSMQWTRSLIIKKGGATIQIPISFSLKKQSDSGLAPMTEAEKEAMAKAYAESPEGIAKAEEQRKRMEKVKADSKARMDELKRKREEKSAMPFDPDERASWISQLDAGTEYGDGSRIHSRLSRKSARNDPELARALFEFANRLEHSMGGMFFDSAAKFDSKFAKVVTLRKAYSNSHTKLTQMGPPVTASMPLRKGQLVAVPAKYGNRYNAKLVVGQDGMNVFVRSLNSDRPETIEKTKIRLPADSILEYLPESQRPQEGLAMTPSPAGNSETNAMRLWTDQSGKYSIEAKLEGVKDGKVILKKEDGTTVAIPLDRLCEADAIRVAQWVKKDNPFQVISP